MAEPRIWILPQEVSERIAAGEVVERPASVVKELVENALDAGAWKITVETEAGGKALIRVTDDGSGMTAEEARIALQRHATSKLRTADDLFKIHTLGFRGEALPSIAAVSALEIVTRTPESAGGTRIRVEAGVVTCEEPTAAQPGTGITVRRLFFSVPVREKFLRSDTAEAGQITDWMQRLALARPDVSFRLVHDGREALLSPGSQDALNAVVAILGRGIARDLIRLTADPSAEVEVSGFVGRPTLSRANRALQHTYVNGRAVRSPLFQRALSDAYRSTMPQGRHPVALLFVEVPPDTVDVNVHPAKVEVRFRDEGSVQSAVVRAIHAALRSEAAGVRAAATGASLLETPPASAMRVAEGGGAFAPASPEALPFVDAAMGGAPPRQAWRALRDRARSLGDHPESTVRDPFSDQPLVPGVPPEAGPRPLRDEHRAAEGHTAPAPAIEELTVLGQAKDLFILAVGGGRFWVIDQHVAHERVLFDQMMAPDASSDPSEPLLIPAAIDVDRTHALALEEHRGLLASLGFGIEPFGAGRYRLSSVPRTLLGRNYESVLRDLADELAARSEGGRIKLRKEEVAMAAAGRSCKSAVKAGQPLSRDEMERLLADLRNARHPHTCPHGRPVFLTFDTEEIARLFGDRACD